MFKQMIMYSYLDGPVETKYLEHYTDKLGRYL